MIDRVLKARWEFLFFVLFSLFRKVGLSNVWFAQCCRFLVLACGQAFFRGCWWGWHLETVRLVSKAFFPCFLLGLAIGDG